MPSDSIYPPMGQVTMSDFLAHPVWTWADEDEGRVMPVVCSDILPESNDALFIACKFRLANRSEILGTLSVRMSDRQVYLLSFSRRNGTLFDFPLQPALKGLVSREQLASFLEVPLNLVFPINYSTAFRFGDGSAVAGAIE
jgi:hypothetical protein